MLLNRNVIKSNNIFLQGNRFIVQPLSVPRNVCAFDPCRMFSSFSIYSLKIYFLFMAGSPKLSGQSIVPRKRSQSGWRSCSEELAFFWFLFLQFFFLTFFLEGSFLFRVCTKIKNNIKCLRILVFFNSLHQRRFSSIYWQVYPFSTLLNQGHASECS